MLNRKLAVVNIKLVYDKKLSRQFDTIERSFIATYKGVYHLE